MNLWVYFLTGLTTGALSCLAVQAGLLASVVANREEALLEKKTLKPTKVLDGVSRESVTAVVFFLGSKLTVHAIFGFLLGAVGSLIVLGIGARLVFQVFAALFLLATAANLLDLHPIFRWVVFQPPKFVRRWLKNNQKNESFFAPVILGALTVFIPCPVTQAVEIAALGSGSAVTGMLILSSFVLGTTPLFAAVGIFTAKFSEMWQERFLRAVAVLLVAMAFFILNGVLVVVDFPLTAQKVWQEISFVFSGPVVSGTESVVVKNGVQKVNLSITNSGYTPRLFRVAVNQPVELTVTSQDAYSCAVDFVFPAFDIRYFFKPSETKIFTFTPIKTGKYTFACSMGMYTGVMEVR